MESPAPKRGTKRVGEAGEKEHECPCRGGGLGSRVLGRTGGDAPVGQGEFGMVR